MNFLRLSDYLISPIYEDADIIAIDKPYGLNCHTNESKVGNEDHVQHGLIEIFERQLGIPLFIVHRLDQTTTGVVIFAKSQESAKKYAEFFFLKQVKKTYFFVTASSAKEKQFEIDQVIIHKGKELSAQTGFRFLKKSAHFECWQAQPLTGRNHQIRIHAQSAGISLLGDEKYGGKPFPFLCLHNRWIEFPNGVAIESKPPVYFEDLSLLENPLLAVSLHEIDRRQRIFKIEQHPDQCFRLVHKADELTDQGFSLDLYGSRLVANWNQEKIKDSDLRALQKVAEILDRPLTVRLAKDKSDTDLQTWTAKESDLEFELQTHPASSVGLFLDQRLPRKWVRENAKGKSVLNLFASTGSFGLMAAKGEAREVVLVDSSKAALQRAQRNFELNGILVKNIKFSSRDSLSYLEVCAKKGIHFDLLICHAPTFYRGEKKNFQIKEDLDLLLKNCLSCLVSDGQLLFLTNTQSLKIGDIQSRLQALEKELALKLEVSLILPALDFELVGDPPQLKTFLIQVRDNIPLGGG